MQDQLRGCRPPSKLAEQVVVSVAPARARTAMEDERLVRLERELGVAAERPELCIARREAAVVVQTCLPDRDDLRLPRQPRDLAPRVVVEAVRDVWMNPDRCMEAVVTRELDRRPR